MDLLDKYKKTWVNQPEDANKLSKIEIYKLAHSKSSSIVKWIFIIGILEFVVLNCSWFFIDLEKANKQYKEIGIYDTVFYSQIVIYFIVIYFLILFYKNYKSISTIENTKTLMQKIIKTRKTVRNYVLLNLSYFLFILIVTSIAIVNQQQAMDSTEKIIKFILLMLVAGTIILGLIWLFYQLLYGILLKKLNKNHKELAKLDELN